MLRKDVTERRGEREGERVRREVIERSRQEAAERASRDEKWRQEKEKGQRRLDACLKMKRNEVRERHTEMVTMIAKLPSK
ncbi:hypothetical protein PC129_g5691 [Phytophthora cactorum]|uniref:Uncharacterized protein n=1 Tax=Phytophthora cactorum TaxID=29920 RepID=A0A329RPC1_9STRA|nr:hypothetical protein Pcac1_g5707 [Phytophthora cactorum]KAG2793795.1 hypothetical protein PC111_g22886 [Phytophthora cactorum]KAG2794297.1 hypothetical protein PC112_g23099 [Phytophthora cactorum]KAG2832998.1 hypothetical protein PC113_g20654 [Phytophthora cactorum]KAG2885371.1 hypothetical protein PC117_g25607 [Phytophthora cactorum]